MRRLAGAAAGLVLAAALSAQTTVYLDGPVPVKTSIGGFNVSNSMLLIKVKDRVASLAPPTWTWPSGNYGDEAPIDRPVLDYLRLQQKFVPAGFWFQQVNLFSGTLDQALAQVALSAELGVKTDAWTIGNEPDLYGPNRGDRSWTPQKYAAVFRQWATALKAAHPDIVISGPAISQPKDDWMRVFLAECGDLVDIVSWHWYPTNGKASDEAALATSDLASSMVARYQGWLTDPAMNPKGYQRPIRTALTEFAVHWDTNNETQINDIVGACWTADVLGRLAEARLDFSHFFCLQEYGGHAIFNAANKPRVLYWVFDFYRDYAHAQRLVRTDLGPGSPVTVHGWTDDQGRVRLVVTNRGPAAPFSAVFPQAAGLKLVEGRQLVETAPVALGSGPVFLPPRSVTTLFYDVAR